MQKCMTPKQTTKKILLCVCVCSCTLALCRSGPSFCAVCLVVKGRGAASGWSSSLLPPCYFWMSQPLDWILTLPIASSTCYTGATQHSMDSALWPVNQKKYKKNTQPIGRHQLQDALPGCPEGGRLWSSPSTSLATPSTDCLTIWPFCTRERWCMQVQLTIQQSTSQVWVCTYCRLFENLYHNDTWFF